MSQTFQRIWRVIGARWVFAAALSAMALGCSERDAASDIEATLPESVGSPEAQLEEAPEQAALEETTAPLIAEPAARGERLFAVCAACHSAYDPEGGAAPPNLLGGPDLWGVIDRAAGAVPGFRYSRALDNGEIVWTTDNLDAFLKSPQRFAPGNTMAYLGMRDETDRADMIAYLETLRS